MASPAYTFDRTQAGQHLDRIYGTERGWMEIAYIDGPPDADPRPKAQTKSWNVWPVQRETILDMIGNLTATYGNVYISASLFDRTYHREKRYTKPSRAILIDDALVDSCTLAVETSPGNYQSWFVLDHPVDAATREQIARRAAYATGGDRGGWDCTQLARVAGTYNTKQKYGEPFAVRLVAGSGKIYSTDELLDRWPAVVGPRAEGDTDLDWSNVALQCGNLDRLLSPDGMPRRTKPGTFTHRVLTGDAVVPDRSVRRYMVCKGLVRVGYPDDEIAAILQTLCNYGHSKEKGADWLKTDIASCITKSRDEWAQAGITITVTPSHGGLTQPAAPVDDTPRKSRARKDRPQRITTLDYYNDVCRLADAMGRINATRAEQAARYNVSVATIARIEHELTEQGFLKRHTARKRGATTSCLEVSRINITAAPVIEAESAPELVVSNVQAEHAEIAHQDAANRESVSPIEGTHPPGSSKILPPAPGIRLADAMLAAIEAAAGEHGRVTKKRVQEQWAAFFAGMRWSDREYSRVMKRRSQSTQLARVVAWAQDAKTQPAELKRKARNLAYQQQRAIEEGHTAKAWALGQQAIVIEDEIEARILRGEIRKRVPKRSVVAVPTVREEQPGIAPSGGCVPSLRNIVVLPRIEVEPVAPTTADPSGIVQRLRNLKAQREAQQGGTYANP